MPSGDSFERYATKQLDAISSKLDSLNVTFMPREEINLRLADITKAQVTITDTVARHTAMISDLKERDDRQQGSINTSRRVFSTGLTLAGILLTALYTYVTLRIGTHK